MWNLVTDPTIPLETKKKPTQKLGTSQRISYRKLVADLRFRHLSIVQRCWPWPGRAAAAARERALAGRLAQIAGLKEGEQGASCPQQRLGPDCLGMEPMALSCRAHRPRILPESCCQHGAESALRRLLGAGQTSVQGTSTRTCNAK